MGTHVQVTDDVWRILPQLRVMVVWGRGIDNSGVVPSSVLARAQEASAEFVTAEVFSQNPVVEQWREVFRRFRTKKGARSSVENLLKRANRSGAELASIGPVVDIYNAVSLTYALPCGAEDLAAIRGDLRLGVAAGGEAFRTLGEDEDSPALPGEVCYLDDAGAVCRCLNWREAERTCVTPATTDVVCVIETEKWYLDRARAACTELQRLLAFHVGGQFDSAELSPDRPSVELV